MYAKLQIYYGATKQLWKLLPIYVWFFPTLTQNSQNKMKNHNFCYNYGFLADWLNANPKIKRYELLHSLDMSDYRTLQNWMEGLTMMPLMQMMKFCNLYNVPITAFFYDEEADEHSPFTAPTPYSMLEPAGGYKESERRAGIKTGDPRTETHQQTRLPNYCKEAEYKVVAEYEPEKPDNSKETSKDERMRYLDIIEKLNDRVLSLNERLLAQKTQSIGMGMHMAAEP